VKPLASILLISPDYPSQSQLNHFQYTATFWGIFCNHLQFRALLIGAIIEDAESGGFTQFPWNNASDSPWYVDDNSTAFRRSINSLPLWSNQRQRVIGVRCWTTWFHEPGEISISSLSFFRRWLRFSSSSTSMENRWRQNGRAELNWAEFSYSSFCPGEHNFSWVYSKDDVFTSANLDAAWVDFIVLPPSDDNTAINFLRMSLTSPLVLFSLIPQIQFYKSQLMGLKHGAYTCTLVGSFGPNS
jgi:hypothetical protein